MTKIVKLKESELKTIIENTLNEVGPKVAAMAHGANYNAAKDYRVNGTEAANVKFTKANMIRLSAITEVVKQNVDVSEPLVFVEYDEEERQMYNVFFVFHEVKKVSERRVIFYGDVNVSNMRYYKGCIEYNFVEGKFYRVNYTKSQIVRRISQIEVMNANANNLNRLDALIGIISEFLEEEKNYENYVDTHGPTISKPR